MAKKSTGRLTWASYYAKKYERQQQEQRERVAREAAQKRQPQGAAV